MPSPPGYPAVEQAEDALVVPRVDANAVGAVKDHGHPVLHPNCLPGISSAAYKPAGNAGNGVDLVVGLIVGPILFSGPNFLELFFLDLRFFLASTLAAPEERSEEIAIIRMDRESATTLGTNVIRFCSMDGPSMNLLCSAALRDEWPRRNG